MVEEKKDVVPQRVVSEANSIVVPAKSFHSDAAVAVAAPAAAVVVGFVTVADSVVVGLVAADAGRGMRILQVWGRLQRQDAAVEWVKAQIVLIEAELVLGSWIDLEFDLFPQRTALVERL